MKDPWPQIAMTVAFAVWLGYCLFAMKNWIPLPGDIIYAGAVVVSSIFISVFVLWFGGHLSRRRR